MANKAISDALVCLAYAMARRSDSKWPDWFLHDWTGQPEKVCIKATEKADRDGYIDYGVSLRSGWLTNKGIDLLVQTILEAKDGEAES